MDKISAPIIAIMKYRIAVLFLALQLTLYPLYNNERYHDIKISPVKAKESNNQIFAFEISAIEFEDVIPSVTVFDTFLIAELKLKNISK